MTRDVFKVEFKRLCDGFDMQPRQGQVDAYYERLQMHHEADWHEAVTDLLCAPKFPYNLNTILEVIEVRAEERRRANVQRENYEAQRACANMANGTHGTSGGGFCSMKEALDEKPELKGIIERILERKLT